MSCTDLVAEVVCPDCGAAWGVCREEREWYLSKGWNLPKRCPDCRRRKRLEKGPFRRREVLPERRVW